MKKMVKSIIYKIILKFQDVYWSAWQQEQVKQFAECGKKVYIGRHGVFTNPHIHIGDNVYIGEYVSLIATLSHIYIGSNVLLGSHLTIMGGNHRIDILGKYMYDITDADKKPENDADVFIEDDVWIGTNVTILKGVRIGTGSVVGAGSIVTRDVPPYTIHSGCPVMREKPRFSAAQIGLHKQLLEKREEEGNV